MTKLVLLPEPSSLFRIAVVTPSVKLDYKGILSRSIIAGA
ncbi:hypothetical protein I3843_01G077800 [Carya illinoinensis]|nr:hypothetical protein I3843_01G077800 [Carya illinoinensis]